MRQSRLGYLAGVVVALCLVVGASGAAGKTAPSRVFGASLSAGAAVPNSSSKATGSVRYRLAADGRSLSFVLRAEGLRGRPVGARVQLGRAGQSGGVLLTLRQRGFALPLSGRLTRKNFTPSGSALTFAAAVRLMRAGATYTNLQTTRFPSGEIRGQNGPG